MESGSGERKWGSNGGRAGRSGRGKPLAGMYCIGEGSILNEKINKVFKHEIPK